MRFLTSELLERRCFLRSGWSRGDVFKFANTTHLDVRHFSVAKENHQTEQPTFPLSFVRERLLKKVNLAAGGGTGSLASLRDWGMGRRGGWGSRGVAGGGDKDRVLGRTGKHRLPRGTRGEPLPRAQAHSC